MSKTIPLLNYYRDSKDHECLNEQYFQDDKNFTNLSPELQRLHLEETIKEYGAELLAGDALVAAKNLGFYTPASSSDTDNSWVNTAADVLSAIPKGLVLALTASEVLMAVGAFPTGYNSNHQSAEPAENPEPILHRNARGATETFVVEKHLDLPNGNCVSLALKTHSNMAELYAHCFQEHCNGQANTNGGNWIADKQLSQPQPHSRTQIFADGEQSVLIKPVFTGAGESDSSDGVLIPGGHVSYAGRDVSFSCLSAAYPSVKEGYSLLAEGNLLGAQEKFNDALNKRPDYSLALEGNAKVLEALAKITTAVPSSTSLTDETSTFTTNSTTMVEETTTPAEPHNAPQKRSYIPTTTPQEQTTEGQGWWESLGEEVKKAVIGIGTTVGTIITIGGTVLILRKLKQWCSTSEEKTKPGDKQSDNDDNYDNYDVTSALDSIKPVVVMNNVIHMLEEGVSMIGAENTEVTV